jgi:cysteine-S-conjugate beta-lyase
MNFDFDRCIDRTGTNSIKWDRYDGKNVLPFWLADMEFACAPAIVKAMQERMQHPVYGYTTPSDDLYDAILGYLRNEKEIPAQAEWLVWLPGIVPALGAFCRAYTRTGDGVMYNSPIYPQFPANPINSKMRSIDVPLKRDGMYYSFDMAGMRNFAYAAKLLMLCNPHNPVGRLYSRDELERVVEFCQRNDMLICSDEIHCDIALEKDVKHTSILAIKEARERSILLMSPSKTFNTPGLFFAFAVIPDKPLREAFKRVLRGSYEWVNIFGMEAACAAYSECGQWRAQLVDYLRSNRDYMREYLRLNIPELDMGPCEATYVAWLDARSLGVENPKTFFEDAGVALSDGADYGESGMLRMNYACPRVMLEAGLKRMKTAVEDLHAKRVENVPATNVV